LKRSLLLDFFLPLRCPRVGYTRDPFSASANFSAQRQVPNLWQHPTFVFDYPPSFLRSHLRFPSTLLSRLFASSSSSTPGRTTPPLGCLIGRGSCLGPPSPPMNSGLVFTLSPFLSGDAQTRFLWIWPRLHLCIFQPHYFPLRPVPNLLIFGPLPLLSLSSPLFPETLSLLPRLAFLPVPCWPLSSVLSGFATG